MPKRQERDVLLAPLHTAHMCSIHAHSDSDGLLAEAGLHAKSAKIFLRTPVEYPSTGWTPIAYFGATYYNTRRSLPIRRQPRLSGSTSQFRKHYSSTRENHEKTMPSPPDPPIAETAPTDAQVTDYDRAHLPTYLRLLDAESDGAPWDEVAPDRARTRPCARAGPSTARSRNPSCARPLAHRAWLSGPAASAALTAAFDAGRVRFRSEPRGYGIP